jgi:hypothetical protein
MPAGWTETSKKSLWEARENLLHLLDAATRRAGEQEALAAARLLEVQGLQDEVVELQVALGDALDREEKYRALLSSDERRMTATERTIDMHRRMNETPMQRFADACRRFGDSFTRR